MADAAQAVKIIVRSSQWNKYEDTYKDWSVKFHFSGDAITGSTAIAAFVHPFLTGFAGLMNSAAYIKQALYYPPGEDVNTWQESYISTNYPGTLAGWSSSESLEASSQLEVCHLLVCPEKISSKGKQVYLRKFLHVGTAAEGSGSSPRQDPLALSTSGAAFVATWETGVSSTTNRVTGPSAVNPSGTWSVRPYLVTRQLRKTPKGH
jgi:hypothetical protein